MSCTSFELKVYVAVEHVLLRLVFSCCGSFVVVRRQILMNGCRQRSAETEHEDRVESIVTREERGGSLRMKERQTIGTPV